MQIENTNSMSICPSEIVLLSSNSTATAGRPRPMICPKRPIARIRVRSGYTGLPGGAYGCGAGIEVGHIGATAGPQGAEIDLRQAAEPHQAPGGADAAPKRGDRGDQVVVDRVDLIELQEYTMGVVFLERFPDAVGQRRLRGHRGPSGIALKTHKQPVWPPLNPQLATRGLCVTALWLTDNNSSRFER